METQTKTTPGPWTACVTQLHGVPRERQYVTVHNGIMSIAKMIGSEGNTDLAMPDALLIAAAPELLKSCKELRDALAGAMRVIVNHDCDVASAFEREMNRLGIKPGVGVRADEAIAKAEGGAA
jgi:hypothetical protein